MALARRGLAGKTLRAPNGKIARGPACCCGNCVEKCRIQTIDMTVPALVLCEVDVSGIYALERTANELDGDCRTCTYGGAVDDGVFVQLDIEYCASDGTIFVSAIVYPEGNPGCHYKWAEEFTCQDWCGQVNTGTVTITDAVEAPVGDLILNMEGECCCQGCDCCLPSKKVAGECVGICAAPENEGPDFRLDVSIPGRLSFTGMPIDVDHFIASESCHSLTCGDNGFNIGEWIDNPANAHTIGATWSTVYPLCGTYITGDGEIRNWTIYFAARCKSNDYTEGSLELKFLFQTDSVCFYGVEDNENYTVWHSEGFTVALDKCWITDAEVDITFTVPMDPIAVVGGCDECPSGLVATIRLYSV